MGGYDPQTGYTIGYSYLAATEFPATPKGQCIPWNGPSDTTDMKEVIADANYWWNSGSQAITIAPHTSGGSVAMAGAGSSTVSSALLTPGSSSKAVGAMGGNTGSLDGSVVWRPISLMGQYPASGDGSANGNW
jgi:hypothetical protein